MRFELSISKRNFNKMKKFLIDQYEYDPLDFPDNASVLTEAFFQEADPRSLEDGDFRNVVKIKEIKEKK